MHTGMNTLGQYGHRFADDTFKRIFLNGNVRISIMISLNFFPKGPINNNPALVQIMAWRRSDDKLLSEPMMVSLLTHICVTRPRFGTEAVITFDMLCLFVSFTFGITQDFDSQIYIGLQVICQRLIKWV